METNSDNYRPLQETDTIEVGVLLSRTPTNYSHKHRTNTHLWVPGQGVQNGLHTPPVCSLGFLQTHPRWSASLARKKNTKSGGERKFNDVINGMWDAPMLGALMGSWNTVFEKTHILVVGLFVAQTSFHCYLLLKSFLKLCLSKYGKWDVAGRRSGRLPGKNWGEMKDLDLTWMTTISFGWTIIFPNSVVIKISPCWGTWGTNREENIQQNIKADDRNIIVLVKVDRKKNIRKSFPHQS